MKIKIISLLTLCFFFFFACKVKKTTSIEKNEMEKKEPLTNSIDTHKDTVTEEVLQYGMFVASKKVSCQGIVLQECLLVRASWENTWSNFYDEIEGFKYEPGYEYHLEVKRTTLKNPPMDASMYRYQLVNLLKKEKKESDTRQEYEKPTFEGTWKLKELLGKNVTSYSASLFFNNGKLNANSGCNSTIATSFIIEASHFSLENKYPMASTLKMCPEGHIENSYFKTFFDIQKYEATPHVLTFFNKKGEIIMTFER